MSATFANEAELVIPDLSNPETFVEDVPHEAFAALRRRPGLHWQPTGVATVNGGFWAVTRWADIIEVEKNPLTFTSTRGINFPGMNVPPGTPLEDNVIMNDPPRHSKLRRAAAKGFGPRVVARFDGWIRDIVRDTIARTEKLDEFDYIEEFARTIPALVVADVLGMPRSDRERLVNWTNATFTATQNTEGKKAGEGTHSNLAPVMAEVAEYTGYIQKVKRENPADDMFTAVGALVDSGELTQSEFFQWMFAMMTAGFETTHTLIGQSMRMYLEEPEVREATDRAVGEGLAGRVTDEYLRLISPPMHMGRTTTQDVTIAGTTIRENDVVLIYFVSANRDETVFAEPNRFNPWRTETDTLAFGSGPHRCIGSHLAHLEVSILWEELRASNIKLRLNGTPKRGWSVFINQLTELPVAQA